MRRASSVMTASSWSSTTCWSPAKTAGLKMLAIAMTALVTHFCQAALFSLGVVEKTLSGNHRTFSRFFGTASASAEPTPPGPTVAPAEPALPGRGANGVGFVGS